MTKPVRSVLLYKTEGSMDKFYGLTITPDTANAALFRLSYMNGPRGGSMKTKPKLAEAVTLEAANKEFDKVQKAKMKDGYTESETGLAYTHSPDAGRVSGYRPMLPADLPKISPQAHLEHMLTTDDWAVQEKKDGENRMLIIQDGQVQGTNKNGLFVNIPEDWQKFAVLGDCVLCGEQIGETFHAFDLIDPAGLTFKERYAQLERLLLKAPGMTGLSLVTALFGTHNKRAYLQQIDQAKGEGLVFKHLHAPYEAGKNSNSYRHKFWESMTCLVQKVNAQRSVAVGAYDSNTHQLVPLGNVTIPANHSIPTAGMCVEVRYLYQFEKGALCQPTYLGERSDVLVNACTMNQITRIKRKGEPINLDDETLSDQARQALAKDAFASNLETLKHFLPRQQHEMVQVFAKGSESQFYFDKAQELADRVRQMPQSYDTDGQGDKAVVQLRYFSAGSEWLVTEKDRGAPGDKDPGAQHQAFGSVDLGQGAEAGYISLAELIENDVEMDFYFEPKTLKEHHQQNEQQESDEAAVSPAPLQ